MVDCSEFLHDYTDFADGQLMPARTRAFEVHLEQCPACARYRRVVREGVQLAQSLPRLQPSEDFGARLQHRLYHVDEELSRDWSRSSEASLAVAVTLAIVIGFSAWAPAARPRPAPVVLPPIAAHAPLRNEAADLLFHRGPLLPGGKYSSYATFAMPEPLAASLPSSNTLLFRYSPLSSYVNTVSAPPQP